MLDSGAWLKWRHQGLGSSDAPVVMGVSPWKTRLQLWHEKRLAEPPVSEPTWPQRRGIELEPRARAAYELTTCRECPPACHQHAEYSFIRASLDGFCADDNLAIEIKCPGKGEHAETVETNKVPMKYFPQIQNQFLASNVGRIDYVSFFEDEIHIVECQPDMAYIKDLLAAESAFWQSIQDGTPPDATTKDRMPLDEEQLRCLHERDAVLLRLAEIESELFPRLNAHPRWIGSGFAVNQTRGGKWTIKRQET